MSTKILLTDGSGVVKGSVFYDSAADEIRIASHDSNSPSHIDGYIAVSSSGLSVNGGGAISDSNITSGTWTPTLTAVSNLDAAPTLQGGRYTRVGSIVTLSARVSVDPTSAASWSFRASLPVPSSFADSRAATGVATEAGGNSPAGVVYSDSANNELIVLGTASGTSAETIYIIAQYQVIA